MHGTCLFWGNTVLCVTLLCHVTETSLVLDQFKEAGEAEPDKGGNGQPGQDDLQNAKNWIHKPKKTFSDHIGSSAGECRAGEVDEASEDGTSPKPSEFDKPLVQDVLRVCKIAPGSCTCFVVADHTDEERAEDIDADAVWDIQSVDDLATHVDKHHDNDLKCAHILYNYIFFKI